MRTLTDTEMSTAVGGHDDVVETIRAATEYCEQNPGGELNIQDGGTEAQVPDLKKILKGKGISISMGGSSVRIVCGRGGGGKAADGKDDGNDDEQATEDESAK